MLLPNETDATTNILTTNNFIYPTLKLTREKHLDSFWFTLYDEKEDERFDNIFQKLLWFSFAILPNEEKPIITKIGFD